MCFQDVTQFYKGVQSRIEKRKFEKNGIFFYAFFFVCIFLLYICCICFPSFFWTWEMISFVFSDINIRDRCNVNRTGMLLWIEKSYTKIGCLKLMFFAGIFNCKNNVVLQHFQLKLNYNNFCNNIQILSNFLYNEFLIMVLQIQTSQWVRNVKKNMKQKSF